MAQVRECRRFWLIVLWANKLVIVLYFVEPYWLIAQCLLDIIINPIASNY